MQTYVSLPFVAVLSRSRQASPHKALTVLIALALIAALVALILGGDTAAADQDATTADPVDMCPVLLSCVLHLSAYRGVEGCPVLKPVPHAWLEQRACNARHCHVLGWYPGQGEVVYLDDRMDIYNNLLHTSIALHEITHWVQGRAGTLLQDCESSLKAEREAYHVQREFLVSYGTSSPLAQYCR